MFAFSSFVKWTVVTAVVVVGLLVAFYFARTHLSVSSDYKKEGILNTEQWIVSFGQEVVVTSARLTPEVKGEWHVNRGFFGVSSLGFTPDTGFVKGGKYVADITIARTYNKSEIINFPQVMFSVSPAPGIISLTIDGEKERVSPQPYIELVVGKEFVKKRLILLIVGQNILFDEIKNEGNLMVWRPQQKLPQGEQFVLQVVGENNNLVIEQSFETVIEPKIVNFFAKKQITPGDKITASFNVPMPATSLPLVFDFPGAGLWTDSRTYEYTVGDVFAGRTYTAKLPEGVQSEEGGSVTQGSTYTLATPGYVVASFATLSSENNIYAPIEVSFSLPVEEKSAENAFRISPSAKGTFSWKGEKLIFTPTKLTNQQAYIVSMVPGVKAKFGLPSNEKTSVSFSTVPEVYKLKVPHFMQEYSRSCESAALRMILAYYGISVRDMDILEKIGYNPRPKDKENNTWDDPRVMFVGYVSRADGDGYGVYGAPVAEAARDFGRTALFMTTITPQSLAKNIKAGNPVILWGYTSLVLPKTTWRVPGGGEVVALPGEHVRVVVGVHGSVTNPIGFYLHDSLSGKQYEYWSASAVMKHFRAVPGVTDQAVVVM